MTRAHNSSYFESHILGLHNSSSSSIVPTLRVHDFPAHAHPTTPSSLRQLHQPFQPPCFFPFIPCTRVQTSPFSISPSHHDPLPGVEANLRSPLSTFVFTDTNVNKWATTSIKRKITSVKMTCQMKLMANYTGQYICSFFSSCDCECT